MNTTTGRDWSTTSSSYRLLGWRLPKPDGNTMPSGDALIETGIESFDVNMRKWRVSFAIFAARGYERGTPVDLSEAHVYLFSVES